MINKLYVLLSMVILGTLGPFVRSIGLPAEYIALGRVVLGSLSIWIASIVLRQDIRWELVKKNLLFVAGCGLSLGANLVCFFKAYETTTVAISSVLDSLGPIFAIMLSPFIFKEKLKLTQTVCIFIALFGTTLISGLWTSGPMTGSLLGIYWGLASGVCYASMLLCNKFVKDLNGIESSVSQLAFASLAILIYIIFFSTEPFHLPETKGILSMLTIGILHTGIAYLLFFAAMRKISTQSTAILCYAEQVTAICLSVFFLHEPLSLSCFCGTVLILGATLFSELRK